MDLVSVLSLTIFFCFLPVIFYTSVKMQGDSKNRETGKATFWKLLDNSKQNEPAMWEKRAVYFIYLFFLVEVLTISGSQKLVFYFCKKSLCQIYFPYGAGGNVI